MAEFLVLAKHHWMEAIPKGKRDKWPLRKRQGYDSRTRMGDIIAVRPDGHEWGSKERLPIFVVIKIPGMSFEDANMYQQKVVRPLETLDDQGVNIEGAELIVRIREHKLPNSFVENMVSQGLSEVTIDRVSMEAQVERFIDNG